MTDPTPPTPREVTVAVLSLFEHLTSTQSHIDRHHSAAACRDALWPHLDRSLFLSDNPLQQEPSSDPEE